MNQSLGNVTIWRSHGARWEGHQGRRQTQGRTVSGVKGTARAHGVSRLAKDSESALSSLQSGAEDVLGGHGVRTGLRSQAVFLSLPEDMFLLILEEGKGERKTPISCLLYTPRRDETHNLGVCLTQSRTFDLLVFGMTFQPRPTARASKWLFLREQLGSL